MNKIINDEILDLVSVDDEVIGQEKRSIIRSKGKSNFRVINGFILNSDKKIWIPRRHFKKELFPLCLDASVGGHVSTGENYIDAFKREVLEELNMNINLYSYYPVMKLTPHDHNTSAFMWVYIIQSDEVPAYNKNDFIEYFWVSPKEFFDRINNGDKAKSDLPKIINVIKNKI